ncbi:hypothetical protein V5O48_001023 [Marasmius crinis-equi]|uniref:Major facilitator superfamily (MFS) profile domain-containing protein n=1 Tax=Marasmius crinis-equi TaxID=585013 RepID=A0ABR3G081_9AGAR
MSDTERKEDTRQSENVDIEKTSHASADKPPNTEGTQFQDALGPKAKRRHFFSPLDRTYADAVDEDAKTVEYTPEEDYKVKRKIDNTVLPLVICSYIFNQFGELGSTLSRFHAESRNLYDQIVPTCEGPVAFDFLPLFLTASRDSGNAHVIEEFNNNFGITDNDKWTLALSIFYVGYCLLEMPANVLQRHIGANRFFFLSLTVWGISSLSFIYAKGYAALLVLRVLIGIGEAGYYAGMIYYLSFWYRRHELALRISLCMTGTYPGAIGGLLAFGLTRAHTSVLTGWQFLFLIEAIPTILMAVAILFFLPSFPFAASFLTKRERAIAQARVNRDHKPQSHGGMTGWQGFRAVIMDINCWMFMIIYASFNVGVATVSYFLPTLIKQLGFTSINAQGMTVAPYAAGWFMVFFQAWHSDRTKDRGYHIMLSCAVSFIGYLILSLCADKSVGASYFALFLVVGGNYSLFPLVICLFLAFVTAFALRTRLSWLNKRNAGRLAAMSEEEKIKLEEITEIADTDPRYVFPT